MSDPIHDGVAEVERRLREASSRGVVSLSDYVRLVDEVADSVLCGRTALHEEVRTSLGDAFGIELMTDAGPRR